MDKKKEKTTINKKKLFRILRIFIIAIIILVLFLGIKKIIEINNQKIVPINEMIGKTAKRKFIKIQDSNGDIFYLPKGFKISENESEQTVKNGLVIIDNTNNKETKGSEFVWIPVLNTDEVFNTNNKEYRTLDSNLLLENKETKEYINIQNSISKYGGFYISRYEAGISEKMQEKLSEANMLDKEGIITKDTTHDFANGKYKPVSKPNSTVWCNIKWGGTSKEKASDNLAGNDEANGVVQVARAMYDSHKTSVKSNLCYGYQWDAIMNFIDSNYYSNTSADDSKIMNSLGYGNYNEELNKTASNTNYSEKNIFDLSGNVWEWTMEGYSDNYRIVRGGSYCTNGEIYSMSSEKEFYPGDYYEEIGFRVALYID